MLFYSIQEIAVIQTKDVGGVESPPPLPVIHQFPQAPAPVRFGIEKKLTRQY